MARRKNNLRALACLPLMLLALAAEGAQQTPSPRDESVSKQTAVAAACDSGKKMNEDVERTQDRDKKAAPEEKGEAGEKEKGEGERKRARVEAGTWGGEHVRVEVREGGADVEFDCAHGTLDEPLEPDASGRFDVRGTYVREGPGPIRLGLTRPVRAARYAGQVSERTLTLTVTLVENSREVGSYTLTRGDAGRLRKCR